MQIKNICLQNNLEQIINPTFYCETSSSLLDLIMINDPDLRIHTVLLGIAISVALKIVFVTLSTAVSKSVLSIR
jgi:ACR3 family arsenite efflux pump ArsB